MPDRGHEDEPDPRPSGGQDDGDDDRAGSVRRQLADATRRVIRGTRVTAADDDRLREAVAHLEQAAALLEGDEYAGPHSQMGHGGDELWEGGLASPAGFFPYSPVIGPLNPLAPPLELSITDDGDVEGTVTLTEPYNGPPWDLTHGGVVALLFDELLGVATIAAAGGGFTGRLTVRYRKPTPIGRPLRMTARVTATSGRKITAAGELWDGDLLTAEAEGLFISGAGPLAESAGD